MQPFGAGFSASCARYVARRHVLRLPSTGSSPRRDPRTQGQLPPPPLHGSRAAGLAPNRPTLPERSPVATARRARRTARTRPFSAPPAAIDSLRRSTAARTALRRALRARLRAAQGAQLQWSVATGAWSNEAGTMDRCSNRREWTHFRQALTQPQLCGCARKESGRACPLCR
jgi:hypothetical protein